MLVLVCNGYHAVIYQVLLDLFLIKEQFPCLLLGIQLALVREELRIRIA